MSIRFARCQIDELVAKYGGQLSCESGAFCDPMIDSIAPIDEAIAGEVAPLLSSRWLSDAARTDAWVLVAGDLAARLPNASRRWVHPDAAGAMVALLDDIARASPPDPRANEGGFLIGEGCIIEPNAVIYPRVTLGARVRIGAGSIIGAPGFGWVRGANRELRRVPQLGGVLIDDDVDIGPLCTVDAGTLGPTRIGRGAKLDAQVHVGHNVQIGPGAVIAAQAGFAGSSRIGAGVLIGGQAGIADHVHIGDEARIAAKSGVIGDVPPGAVVAGYPAVDRTRWMRAMARLLRKGSKSLP